MLHLSRLCFCGGFDLVVSRSHFCPRARLTLTTNAVTRYVLINIYCCSFRAVIYKEIPVFVVDHSGRDASVVGLGFVGSSPTRGMVVPPRMSVVRPRASDGLIPRPQCSTKR